MVSPRVLTDDLFRQSVPATLTGKRIWVRHRLIQVAHCHLQLTGLNADGMQAGMVNRKLPRSQ